MVVVPTVRRHRWFQIRDEKPARRISNKHQSAGHASNVRIDREQLATEAVHEHALRGLQSDAGQRREESLCVSVRHPLERFECDLAKVSGELVGDSHHTWRFLVGETGISDERF
ncbi:hypothetical protein [Mesorhizobium sp. LNHC209A00]|uniref:hypothetical protein n=1 Tax=Mesorhizobium sp. LNHC209A00 TaxID=1287226 RepID=UPI001FD99A02|nr:hypothetical protein [Mesorhizobium sp. LNHC209A00]